MSTITFNKDQLTNLKEGSTHEYLLTSPSGAWSSSTIINYNTRKYHGLFITPQPAINDHDHLLVSAVDESIIQKENIFNLAIRRYSENIFHPRGHKYMEQFSLQPNPVTTWQIGNIRLERRIIFTSRAQLLIRYELLESDSPITLRLTPFLAFRDIHQLTQANIHANTHPSDVPQGISFQLYPGYSKIFFQFSKTPDYTHVPDWYYNIEYPIESLRGYPSHEDLFVPGYFDLSLTIKQHTILSIGLHNIDPLTLSNQFQHEEKQLPQYTTFHEQLTYSANQFIIKNKGQTMVKAGYPWFGSWGRDTFIALPGLTLVTRQFSQFKSVIKSMVKNMQGPLFTNMGEAYNSADAPLWFFRALQHYINFTGDNAYIWKTYGKVMKTIIEGFNDGTLYHIKIMNNHLLWAGETGMALTWMDAIAEGIPVTPRTGFAVELNALWINALSFTLALAKEHHDNRFINKWQPLLEQTQDSFIKMFWNEELQTLADTVNDEGSDYSIRPNMIIATSLPNSPLSTSQMKSVFTTAKKHLLTPRGLRTLSPRHPNYKSRYYGDQTQRDRAYHQGTVWPWLLGPYADTCINIYGNKAVEQLTDIIKPFSETLLTHGVGSVSEIYDGDPPHYAGGTIAQAWSIAELLRIDYLIKKYTP